jgi:uncharacterized membrane protein YdjX (TVP38/TMEM64 family)
VKRHYKALVFVIVLAALGAAAVWLPLREGLLNGIAWIQTQGSLAWLIYVLTYIVATVLLMPGSILTLAAGFVFGLPLGVALVSVGSVLGASAAFFVGRFMARDWVSHRIADLPRFRALDSASRHDGFTIVLLARLSPLFPFNLLNYGLGITGVHFKHFLAASWIGMLPGTVLYVYIGSLASDVTELTAQGLSGGWGRALLIAGFAATVVLTVFITRKATQALNAHLAVEPALAGDKADGRRS